MTQRLMALVLGSNMVFNVEYNDYKCELSGRGLTLSMEFTNVNKTVNDEELKQIIFDYVISKCKSALEIKKQINLIDELVDGAKIGHHEEWWIGEKKFKIERLR